VNDCVLEIETSTLGKSPNPSGDIHDFYDLEKNDGSKGFPSI